MKAFGLAVFLLTCTVYAHAQVILKDNLENQAVQEVYHFSTTNNSLDIRDVANQQFKFIDADRMSLGYSKAVHWFRFDVVSRSSRTFWFLEIAFPLLDHVEFYSFDEEGKWKLQYSGDLYKMSTRTVQHRNFVFPFYIRSGTRESFYVKVVTTSAVQVPMIIRSPRGLHESIYNSQFIHGTFYGIMLIMICYNFFLFVSIKDRTILYYVLALIAGTIVVAYFNGFGFYYLNPEWPEFNRMASSFASPFFVITSVALTRSFLELKRFSFWLDRTLVAIAIVAVIFSLITVALHDYISYIPMRLISLGNFATILVSAIYCWRKNFRPARYFLLAWGTVLILGICLLLRNVGIIEQSWLIDNALYLGGVLQVMLISFAFGDRFSVLQKENVKVKEQALRHEQEEKVRLEREVSLRTEEIRLKNTQLEESNQVKNKLFSIVSHDLRGPLISLQGILDMVNMDSMSPEDIKNFTGKVGVRLHHTADFLDNLLQWSRMQMQGEKFVIRKENFPLQHLLISSTQVLRAEAERKNIRLTVDAPPIDVCADMTMMQTVVRNLVSNALKFTHPAGKIEVTAEKKDQFVSVKVADTGIGISPDELGKLFTLYGITKPGTQLEKGTGIGLAVCKEFVERNGGKISVTSVLGKGTTFEFSILLATE